jgi:hypothetical protein
MGQFAFARKWIFISVMICPRLAMPVAYWLLRISSAVFVVSVLSASAFVRHPRAAEALAKAQALGACAIASARAHGGGLPIAIAYCHFPRHAHVQRPLNHRPGASSLAVFLPGLPITCCPTIFLFLISTSFACPTCNCQYPAAYWEAIIFTFACIYLTDNGIE